MIGCGSESRTTGLQMVKKRPMKDYEDAIVFYKKQPIYYNTELTELDKPIKSWLLNGKGANNLNDVKTDQNGVQKFTNFNRQTLKFNNRA